MSLPMPSREVLQLLRQGVVIPASPLALDAGRKLDERYQRALYRYYEAAGAGGVAVAVHTTQFEIRDVEIGLFQPVLELAAETLKELEQQRPLVKIAGVCGKTPQAVREAELARSLGYDAVLLSLGAFKDESEDALVEHCRQVSRISPLMGFYLQPAVGGRVLSHSFWRKMAEIENLLAIKMAPFNRYQTLDVVRAVAMAGREEDVMLYTGNDDNIILDLLIPFRVQVGDTLKSLTIRGGLLGQWSVWTKTAVCLLDIIHEMVKANNGVPLEMLERSVALTDANAVIFDAANQFAGCIPGINEVLRRQGLLRYSHCLDPDLGLSPGQSEELDRIARDYPWLADDDFVAEHRDQWLR